MIKALHGKTFRILQIGGSEQSITELYDFLEGFYVDHYDGRWEAWPANQDGRVINITFKKNLVDDIYITATTYDYILKMFYKGYLQFYKASHYMMKQFENCPFKWNDFLNREFEYNRGDYEK